jgi:PAS domain S-box-containing protein
MGYSMRKKKDLHIAQPESTDDHLPVDDKTEQQPTDEFPATTDLFLQNFKRIIDATHDSVISLDAQGRISYWNPSSEVIYGYKAEEVVGKRLKSFLVPEEKQSEFTEIFKKVSGRGEHVTDLVTRRKTKDGTILDVIINVFALRDENGKIIGSCGVAKDITQELADREQLKKQHDILQQAEELAGIGSWEYNIKTKEFSWSDGMFRLFKIADGTNLDPSMYLDNAFDGDRHVAEKIVHHIESKLEPFEEIVRFKIGSVVKTFKVKGAPLKNGKGEVEKMIGVDMDVTSGEKSEKTIKELNKELRIVNAELKNFASIAANNYSETLRHLYIFLELIVTHDARTLSNSGRANLRRAQSAIQKMKLLTEDINRYLQLYEMGAHKAMIDPHKIIQSTLSSMSKKIDESNATVELTSLLPLYADPLLFSILITCMVDNAIKFRKLVVPPVIKIWCSRADEINAVPGASKEAPYIILSISDNGIGFDEQEAEKIFELFFQLNTKGTYKGSGIGLAICKKIMDMHGGFITAEARPAHGATFSCYFPAGEKIRRDYFSMRAMGK